MAAAQVSATRGSDPVAGSFVANQPTLGGNLRLPCESINNDGVCEIATLRGGSRMLLARTLLAMSTGSALPKQAMRWISVSRTVLEFDNEVPAFGDGEDLGRAREFQVSVEHAAVRIRCARAAASEGMFAVQPAKVNVMAISSATE